MRASQLGLFGPDERLELLDGQIVEKITQNAPHFTTLRLIQRWLESIAGSDLEVRAQGPIQLDPMSLPEPDIAVVKGTPRNFAIRHPRPDEILLLVEVADSSLDRDRNLKSALYARAGVPELWIVDVSSRRMEVFREPDPQGYRLIRILNEDEGVEPLFDPGSTLSVKSILP